jgi:dTDP-4-amino-4,6-dideoxygalactose transaminase
MIEEPEVQEVVDCLRSGWISTGPRVGKFEEMFREYLGSRHARALASCTAGLHLSMLVSGVKSGDEVITTPMTFVSTANVITHVGAVPVFADVDRRTMNIDPAEVRKRLSSRTRALIPVHLAGRPCDMDPLMAIARERNLIVIEDAAHAIEAAYHGRKIGTIGDLACFSFYVTKNIVTGEGGMVTTERDDWAEQIEMYGLHGLNKGAWRRYSDEGFKHYQVVYPGYKYNMTDMQAALGLHQLPRIERYLKRREEIWARYDAAFRDLPVITPAPPAPGTKHARHLYTLLLDIDRIGRGRDEIQQALHRENIGTGIHFIAAHLHQYYRERFGYRRGDFPNSEYISDRTISLPLSAKLTDEDIADVIAAVRKVLA